MNTLRSSSSKIVVDKLGVSPRELFFCRPETCSFRARKVVKFGFLHLISAQHKGVPVVSCLSSTSQAELGATETEIEETYPSKSVHVKFQLRKECMFGEQFLIVGGDPAFGSWDPTSAIPLNWSDGHVWTVQLDIPVGKSINFKFILKRRTGDVLWQAGPDRIFQTWETENTVVVCEDWDDAQLQKIIEEEQSADQNEQVTASSGMLVVAENLSHPKEELGSVVEDGNTSSAEESIVEPQKGETVPEVAHSPRNPKPIVADNISFLKEEQEVNGRSKVLDEKLTTDPNAEFTVISSKGAVIAEDMLGTNGRPPTVKKLGRTGIEGNLINDGAPVLVPGLTSLSTVPIEEPNQDEIQKRIAEDAYAVTYEAKNYNIPEVYQVESDQGIADAPQGANEAKNRNSPEVYQVESKQGIADAPLGSNEAKDHIVPELEEKQEQEGHHPPQLAPSQIFKDEEEHTDNESERGLNVPQGEEQPHSEPMYNNVLQKDIRWGRNTLQKLLTSLGLL